ncbi:IST1 family protein [Kocuria palustris]|nr:IST1 family protein [Kocuria palustris]
MSAKQPLPPFNPSRLKTLLKMAILRAQLVQEKKLALAKQQRRQLADLLNQGKEQSATIRVENIIREDIYIELLEYIELYCELLLARISLIVDPELTECDSNIKEAVALVIYLASHSELKEITQIRDQLIAKYGVDFGKQALDNVDNIVPEKIVNRCNVPVPKEELVTLYLCEIARAYNAPYSNLPKEESVDASDNGADDDGDNGGSKELPIAATEGLVPQPSNDFDALKARFAALKRT